MLFLTPLPQRLDSGATPTFAGILTGDGTAAAPSISFSSDSDTGFYRANSNVIGVSTGGVAVMNFSRSGASGRISGTVVANEMVLLDSGGLTLTAGGTNQNITLTPSGTGVVSLAGPLQLSNAYAAGVVVSTGTIIIKDSTGTSYRVACAL